MPRYLTNVIISVSALTLLIFLVVTKCSQETRKEVAAAERIEKLKKEHSASKAEFEDSLNFVRGQAELQRQANLAHMDRIRELEAGIDDLQKRHTVTKKKIKELPQDGLLSDTGFVLAPNEYVTECEQCFSILDAYKKENKQLGFERDSYDSLLRQQSDIQSVRIERLEQEKTSISKAYSDLFTELKPNRKLKISAMGMLNDLFTPNGGGPGLIYEDKKYNEFGGHVLFTNRGNMYLFHFAKTISFKRKK